MIFTTPMKQLAAVVLDHDVDNVTRELLRQGVMHFISIRELPGDWGARLGEVASPVSAARIAETRKRIESFLRIIAKLPAAGLGLDLGKLTAVDLEETNKALDKLAAGLQGRRERQKSLQQEILKLEDIQRQLALFGDIGAGIQARSQYSFLTIQAGIVQNSYLEAFGEALAELPSVHLRYQDENQQTTLLLITMKRDDAAVSKILDKFGWTDVELPAAGGMTPEVTRELGGKLVALRQEQESVAAEVSRLVTDRQTWLEELWANLRMNELYARIQSYFSKTAKTVLFSGWIPASRQQELEKALRQASRNRCYLEWHQPGELEDVPRRSIPVKFGNPRFLAPFQMLVENYSTPEYGTIDPTPLVAVAYLIMFGLMFGDAGHGAVLFLIGFLGARLVRGAREGVRNLFKLITWCGASAIVTGAVFGSYFGRPWLPPLWFDYHAVVVGHGGGTGFVKDIYGILLITIYFGIAVIGLGLLLNWINLTVKREWLKLVLDKGGLLGGWMYAAGVYTAFYFVSHGYKELPPGGLLFWMLGLPSLILLAKPPLEFFLPKGGHGLPGLPGPHPAKRFTALTPVDFLMEWVVEMLEIFSGYLANTLSFMRVAGLGIAHVSLMTAFMQIAVMVGGGDRLTAGSYLVLFAGNLLVIALEGLSAGIQSLRLNYYEFFSKYFSGAGTSYTPVSLRSED
jgi:V/A-type H+-transporting ATPase subunit I